MTYRNGSLVLFICIVLLQALPICQATNPLTPPSNPEDCKSALVMEATTGEIIYEFNSHTRLAPASMTKMMLVYITMNKIKEGELSLDDIVTTSANASRMGGSQVYLAHNEQFTLGELMKAVMIQSANDASMAIAELIAGSSTGFVDLMNAEAKKLQMNDTLFQTPHGLPPGKDQSPDLTSSHDLAILAREIILQHPEVLKWSSKETEPFRDGKFIMTNTNRLIRQLKGCDGLKTGYYRSAGFSVTATAKQNGVRIIAVVMGCENGKHRFAEAARLIKWGLMKFQKIDLIQKDSIIENSIPVIDGVLEETTPITAESLSAVVRKDRIKDIVMNTTMDRELTSPIETGLICGCITFVLDDRELGRTDLVTSEHIEALNWWGKLKRTVGM